MKGLNACRVWLLYSACCACRNNNNIWRDDRVNSRERKTKPGRWSKEFINNNTRTVLNIFARYSVNLVNVRDKRADNVRALCDGGVQQPEYIETRFQRDDRRCIYMPSATGHIVTTCYIYGIVPPAAADDDDNAAYASEVTPPWH